MMRSLLTKEYPDGTTRDESRTRRIASLHTDMFATAGQFERRQMLPRGHSDTSGNPLSFAQFKTLKLNASLTLEPHSGCLFPSIPLAPFARPRKHPLHDYLTKSINSLYDS
jgi:hypothetical protein